MEPLGPYLYLIAWETEQLLEKLERPVFVYDINHRQSRTGPCPIFSTGHGATEPWAHGEEGVEDNPLSGEKETIKNEHGNTTNSHCGNLIPKDKIYRRHQLFPSEKYHKTFFVWTSSAAALSTIIDTFNSTALVCPQKVDGGVFHLQTRYGIELQSRQLRMS